MLFTLVLTLLVATIGGTILFKLKVPGGMLVGSALAAAVLSVGFDMGHMPLGARVVAQLTAGAFIGTTMTRADILRLKTLAKPASVILGMHMVSMLSLGTLLYFISPLDLATAFFSAIPGGLTDVPLIAADMGANAPKVAMAQFTRMILVMATFPTLISVIGRKEQKKTSYKNGTEMAESLKESDGKTRHHLWKRFIVTYTVALAFGFIGFFSGVPAGVLAFSVLGVLGMNLMWGNAALPRFMRKVAQVLAGAFIGTSVTQADLLGIHFLILPFIVLIMGYFANCFLTGWMLRRISPMGRKESMLAATPAGASDMALISMDMGVESTDLVVLQIVRLAVVILVFPQVIALVMWLVG